MATLGFEEIMGRLKKKDFSPVYLLHGEESFYIDRIADQLVELALDESEKSFNLTIFYGKDADANQIADTARRYPVMAERQVVVLKEAQQMKDLDALDKYFQKPVPSTVLVVCHKHGKVDGRKKTAKTIAEKGVVFESKKLYDNQVPAWIADYLKARGRQMEPEAGQLLAEYLGTDLSKIGNELDKLLLNLPAGAVVTKKAVADNIGMSKEFNVFELQSALAEKNAGKAVRIGKYFAANPKENPLVKVIGSLSSFFTTLYVAQFLRQAADREMVIGLFVPDPKPADLQSGWQRLTWKLREYKTALKHYDLRQTEQAIAVLREYDLKSKGLGSDSTEDGELMVEMLWKLLHGSHR
jgi:DNA polymerase-3 subunit delta